MIGFWIFMSALVICDTWVYVMGHESVLHRHRTPAEKAIRRKQTGLEDD